MALSGFKVDLTEEERNQVIAQAIEKKTEIVAGKLKAARLQAILKEVSRDWEAKDVFEYFRFRAGSGFILDETNHPAIKALCYYFANDKKFEKIDPSYSLDKGLCLSGPVGTGKTTLMSIFAQNKRASFQVMSCRRVADMYSNIGPEFLHTYSRPLNVPSSLDTFYQNKIGVCFDDLGTENTRSHYGDKANVMQDILLNRYDNGTAKIYTHITTNLSADQIEQYYGPRVRSRMREMFNAIEIGGNDRRK